jgi:thiol-disulfide isomerase/thioredoxin
MPALQAEGWVNGAPPAPGAPGVRLLVVDAWAIWCPYCDGCAPGLVRLYEKYSAQGVAFASITNHEREVVENFVRRFAIRWPHGFGTTTDHVVALGVGSGMPGPIEYEIAPTLYLVGADGRVRWIDGRGRQRHQEPKEWEQAVSAAIAEALGEPAKP